MQMQTLMKNIFGHERLKELSQEPCQIDSLRLSLLYPHSFICKRGVGVSSRISPKISSSIGIKVKKLPIHE